MFKVLTNGCETTRGSKYSAAVDLFASKDCIIAAGETKIIGLGVRIDLDVLYRSWYNSDDQGSWRNFLNSHYLELHPRSSLRAKGLISNTGIIDLDYDDEIKIIIHNPLTVADFGENEVGRIDKSPAVFDVYKIKKGDKIAQILLKEHKSYLFGIESNEERTGGFGSTGE